MSVFLPMDTQRSRLRGNVGIAVRMLAAGILVFFATQMPAQPPAHPSDATNGPSSFERGLIENEAATGTHRTERGPASELMIGWKQIRHLFLGLAGIPMWALVACSIILLMFIVDRLVVLRKARVLPIAFTSRMIQHMQGGDLDDDTARELVAVCREHGSPISTFFGIVLQNRGRSAFEIRTAVGDEADTEIYKLKLHIRAIGALANLAPLLGLFGTVIGMIDAFRSLSQQDGGHGKSELLAQGISLALVATASGLGVAITASVFYYFLQSKFEQRIQDIEIVTNQAVTLVASYGRVPRLPQENVVHRK